MKLNQLENIEHLDEAPQGMFKRAGLKMKSAFGSNVAKGQLQSGEIANKLKSEYMQYVGRQSGKYGNKPTTQTLVQFLSNKGLDSATVARMIDKEIQAAKPPVNPNNVIQFQPNQKVTWTSKKDGTPKTATVVDPEKGPGGQPNSITVKGKGGAFPLPKNTPGLKVANESIDRYRKNFERIDWSQKDDQKYFEALEFMGVMEAEVPGKVLDKVMNIVAVDMDVDDKGQMTPSTNANTAEPDAPAQGKGAGLMKGIGKAIGGIANKAVSGVKSGLGDNPQDQEPSKIFDPEDEESGKMQGSLNYQNISKQFPGLDPAVLRRSMSKSLTGKDLTKAEHETMSAAFTQLLKKDPQETVKVMNLFKMAKEV
jgi:hypothetical protein